MLAIDLTDHQLGMILELNGSLGLDSSVTIPLQQQHAWNITVAAKHFLNFAEAETRRFAYPTPARTQQTPSTHAGPARTPGHGSKMDLTPVIDLTSPTKTPWVGPILASAKNQQSFIDQGCQKWTLEQDTASVHC